MDINYLLGALRIGGWANIAIGLGHLIAMFRLREISAWVGGPSVEDPTFHPLFSSNSMRSAVSRSISR